MNFLELMQKNESYSAYYDDMPNELQIKAKNICLEYNLTRADEEEKRQSILARLFGTKGGRLLISPNFNCDYGFNIHFHGFSLINYNCVILDTSPVNIGDGVLIAPGVCIACAGHAIFPEQRVNGVLTSSPITIEDGVWIGANSTVCGGVTIGKNSIIGAGSVVNKSIPSNVIAVGNPCRVLRKITEKDRITPIIN